MPFKFRDIERRLRKLGFVAVRQKGSHVLFSNGSVTFPVPNHKGRDISLGVERQILKLINKSPESFRQLG